MAFENIDVYSLKNSLNSCKNSINNSISKDLVSGVVNDNVWLCDSRNNLKKALSNMLDIYKQLEDDINRFLVIANQIESYKILQEEVNDLENQYAALSEKLYYTESYKDWYTYTDENGEQQWDYSWETRTVKDTNVESQMISIKNQINEKKNRMEQLKNTINNSI